MKANNTQTKALHDPALIRHARLLVDSYKRLTGRNLLSSEALESQALAETLFLAPFVLLSHDTQTDPRFNYGNLNALRLFELDWDTLLEMPSRQSAEPVKQDERARLLEKVSRDGYIDDYRGIRISSTGQRFWIEQATVWNIRDEQGRYHGQAAAFAHWTAITDNNS